MSIKLTASPANVLEGGVITLKTTYVRPAAGTEEEYDDDLHQYGVNYQYDIKHKNKGIKTYVGGALYDFDTSGLVAGNYTAQVTVSFDQINSGSLPQRLVFLNNITGQSTATQGSVPVEFSVVAGHVQAAVTMRRTAVYGTDDQALWVAIRNRSSAIEFNRYQKFIHCIFCENDNKLDFNLTSGFLRGKNIPAANCLGDLTKDRPLTIQGPYAYALLKLATQVFLTLECGVVIREDELFHPDQERIRLNDSTVTLDSIKNRLTQYLQVDNLAVLPYLDRIVNALVGLDPAAREEVLPYCEGILQHRLTTPSLLELIWSYWQEEGMLIQTMNAIAFRFQNMRSSPRDPLGELEIDPLRPLNNLLWGLIQDEHNRLTIPRRAYEYDHHYGLKLVGKAVPGLASADSRSKFIEAFHNLLYRTAIFYREDADTTVIADAFPLLNALKEVHLLLAEGAHNQFGDLPWTARAEMLIMQWLLARTEMREFLRGRHMVPYQEAWMGAVDCMKKLQGWTDTTVTHFHELAVTGERIVLSIRYGDWVDIDNTEEQAKNWARYWKPEIQRYIHGYQAATGVDLMAEITDNRDAAQRFLQPSILLQRRLAAQTGQGRIAALPRAAGALTAEVSGFAELPVPRRSRLLRYREDE